MIENESVKLKSLLFYLENSDSGFCVVEVNEAYKQSEIVDYILKSLLVKKVLLVDFAAMPEDSSHLVTIRKCVEENPDFEVMLVQNIHTLSEKYGGDEELVKDINFSREAYADLKKIFLFFWPTYFVDTLMQNAPDFWDFVPVKFKFLSEFKGAFQSVDPEREMADERYLRNRAAFLEKALQEGNLSEKERLEKLVDIARIYESLYEYEKARSKYYESLKLVDRLGDMRTKGEVLEGIGRTFYHRSNYDRALECYKKSLVISRELGYKLIEIRRLYNIAQVYIAIENYESSLEHLKNALEISRQLGEKKAEGRILNSISDIYRLKGSYEEAFESLEMGLALSRETSDRAYEGIIINSIGEMYIFRENYKISLEYFEKALSIAKNTGDGHLEGATLYNIGQTYAYIGNYRKSLENLQKSLNIAREIGYKELESAAFEGIDVIIKVGNKQTPTVKTGRNDLCPCGSGKKYKKCCGK